MDDTERSFSIFRSGMMIDPFHKQTMKGRMKHEAEKLLWAGAGLAQSVLGVGVFIGARRPYAAIVCFSILAIKACLMFKGKA